MLIEIEDDFDLQKIVLSGQCFCVRQFNDGTYRFVAGDSCIYIKNMGNRLFQFQVIWMNEIMCGGDILILTVATVIYLTRSIINIPLLMKQCNLAEVFVFFGKNRWKCL